MILFARCYAVKNKLMSNKKQMIPEINSKVLSVRFVFCDRFRTVRCTRSLIFFTPASVSPPPQISSDLRFLKSAWHKNIRSKNIWQNQSRKILLVKFEFYAKKMIVDSLESNYLYLQISIAQREATWDWDNLCNDKVYPYISNSLFQNL